MLSMAERDLLAAARRGDEAAFARLVEPYRAVLHAHCYRMLGSYQDAEDALQETLLSAWRALPRFEQRSSLKSWLYKIATNASLKAIERRPKRVLPIDYGPAADPHDALAAPLVESVWIEPYPESLGGGGDLASRPDAHYEHRESLELAFVAALQNIPARQRAVLILRDVLGFSAKEVGEALDISSVAVDSALQRAHKTVDERLPDQSQQATIACARRRAAARDRRPFRGGMGASRRRLGRRTARARCDVRDAAAPHLVSWAGQDRDVHARQAARSWKALAARGGRRERATGVRLLSLGCAGTAVQRGRRHGAHAGRRSDHRHHVLPQPVAVRRLRSARDRRALRRVPALPGARRQPVHAHPACRAMD